jgi:hypothetical protein
MIPVIAALVNLVTDHIASFCNYFTVEFAQGH